MATEHFSDWEIACQHGSCPHCGGSLPTPLSLRLLEELRFKYGKPMPVTSGKRCHEYDALFGGKGAHEKGAFDIGMPDGRDAYWLVYWAMRQGWTGIGVRRHGDPSKQMIHLDRRAHVGPELTPCLWSYP